MGPNIRTLVEYWHARCRNGLLPGRRSVDPAQLKPLLPSMFLIDCPTRDEGDWTYRLIGTDIVNHEGYDKTGRSVCDYYTGSAWPMLRNEYLQCMNDHRPMYRADRAFDRLARESFDFERIFLPLARDGCHVDMIVGVVEYLPYGTIDDRLIA